MVWLTNGYCIGFFSVTTRPVGVIESVRPFYLSMDLHLCWSPVFLTDGKDHSRFVSTQKLCF